MSISSFIYCVESLVYGHKYPQWETCFEKLALDPKPIGDCYTSGYGTQDYEIFIGYICMAYEGNLVPKACGNLVLIPNRYGVKQEPVFPAIHNKEITTLPTRIKSAITMWIRKISMKAEGGDDLITGC
ncbi:Thioredoxin superfamily protein [Citrus sinensis]|nr:Thioredoxin superfamily protein [Citrus sinensis]